LRTPRFNACALSCCVEDGACHPARGLAALCLLRSGDLLPGLRRARVIWSGQCGRLSKQPRALA
jgi:hypothetical protein